MLRKIILGVSLAAFFSAPALAVKKFDKKKLEDLGVIVGDTITKKECGACHLAFGPINLPKSSWKKIMSKLSSHFGEDASLDEKSRKHIEDFMVSKAMDSGITKFGEITAMKLAKRKKRGKPVVYMRMSSTPSWRRHHDEEHVKPEEWKKVKSKADCRACHPPGVGG